MFNPLFNDVITTYLNSVIRSCVFVLLLLFFSVTFMFLKVELSKYQLVPICVYMYILYMNTVKLLVDNLSFAADKCMFC